MWKIFTATLSAALVSFLIAVLAIPTDHVVGRLKFAINRADQRDDRSERLSEEVSRYVFAAQIMREFFARNLDAATVHSTIAAYNEAVVNLRAHEYANRAMIRKYWSDDTARQFDAFMSEVRSVDAVAHRMNDPLVAFIGHPSKPTVLTDSAVKAVSAQMTAPLSHLCRSGEALLFSLSGVTAPSVRNKCD